MKNMMQIAKEVLALDAVGPGAVTLSVLCAEADEKGVVAADKFPIKLVGGRHLLRDDAMCLLLDQQGFIDTKGTHVRVLGEVIEGFMNNSTTTTTRTSPSSQNKKTSNKTSKFIFESGHPSGKTLAFLPEIGPRVRRGMVAEVLDVDPETAQLIIFEVCARVKSGGVSGDSINYTRGIVSKAAIKRFVPAAGLVLADELDALIL